MVPMKLPYMMTAQYPCNFTGTSLTQCCNLAIAMQVQYNYFKSRAYNDCANFFVSNDHLKSCDLCMISMHPFLRCPCGERAIFLQNHRAYGDPTAPVKLYNIYGFRAAAAQKWEFRHKSRGAVNLWQVIRKLGITLLQKHFSIYITHIHSP